MPKIIRFHRIGGPENLELEDAPSRQPAKSEAKLRVQVIGLKRGRGSLHARSIL
jgi:NADPH:quinone reductase-like Zn-dependent oxidoreductase